MSKENIPAHVITTCDRCGQADRSHDPKADDQELVGFYEIISATYKKDLCAVCYTKLNEFLVLIPRDVAHQERAAAQRRQGRK